MNKHLVELMKRMPPPDNPVGAVVDWDVVEGLLGLSYPVSFKEFVSIYGRSTWFDHAKPIYVTGESRMEVESFADLMKEKVGPLRDNTYVYNRAAGKRKKIDLPLFPDEGGLFPFMIDFSGSIYCWDTRQRGSEKWPVVCCFTSQILVLKNLSVPQMFLEWMEGKLRMVDLWGDIADLPPERICLG